MQVLPIWEGTSSINALDIVRAINKTRGAALAALVTRVDQIAAEAVAAGAELADTAAAVARAAHTLAAAVGERGEQLQHLARDLTSSIAHTYIAALLIGECETTTVNGPAKSQSARRRPLLGPSPC